MTEPVNVMYEEGRRQALALQKQAPAMTGTEVIAQEGNIPAWNPNKDYSAWAAGYPVADEGQVWLLLQPHNSAHYTGRPSGLRALWGLAHTTDPAKAKPWVEPYGTSGMYMTGECCTYGGHVWRSDQDNNVWAPGTTGVKWADLGTIEEVMAT